VVILNSNQQSDYIFENKSCLELIDPKVLFLSKRKKRIEKDMVRHEEGIETQTCV
jgi:hypothetical protein